MMASCPHTFGYVMCVLCSFDEKEWLVSAKYKLKSDRVDLGCPEVQSSLWIGLEMQDTFSHRIITGQKHLRIKIWQMEGKKQNINITELQTLIKISALGTFYVINNDINS